MTAESPRASIGRYEFRQTILTPKDTFASIARSEESGHNGEVEGMMRNMIEDMDPIDAKRRSIDFRMRAEVGFKLVKESQHWIMTKLLTVVGHTTQTNHSDGL